MTPEIELADELALSLFKAGLSLARSGVDHAAKEGSSPKQVEYMLRELGQERAKLEKRLQQRSR